MLHPVTARILAVAACGWLLAAPASAVSLGRAHGAVLIGRPLEVVIPVTVDGPEGEAPCASADLFYGDNRVASPTVRFESTGSGEGTLHVTSSFPVTEPMVTVYLKVGCGQVSSRRYVLLSELPPQDEPAARVSAPRVAAPLPAAPAVAPVAAPSRPAVRERAALAPAPAARPAAPATRVHRPAAAAQARLKLEPLDLSEDRDPALRLSSELGAPARIAPAQRASLASLWQALQRTPEQSVEDAMRLQGLQRDLEAVRDAGRQNAVALAELRAQVERSRSDRNIASGLVAVLAAVLAALVAWLGWRWYNARQLERVGRWFEVNGSAMQAHAPIPPSQPAAPSLPTLTRAVVPAPAAAPRVAPQPPGRANSEDFAASRGGPVRMVGVEELIDVHDKADFFLSIGETEQAVRVLEAHVHDHVETGALAWMDLLDLYHSLGRRADFDRVRGEFRQRFFAQVPDFEHFDEPTASLESYSRALSRIVALWPSRKVLEVIEESIFRKPGLAGAEPFSLAAYRELVLLYHIARDMAPEPPATRDPATATNFSDTSLQPLNMTDRPDEPPLTDHEKLMIPPSSARLGVDIDLGESDDAASELAPLDFDISTFDPGEGAGKRG